MDGAQSDLGQFVFSRLKHTCASFAPHPSDVVLWWRETGEEGK